MSSSERIIGIVNPVSGAGRAARKLRSWLPKLHKVKGVTLELAETSFSGHASQLAQEAIADGYDKILAIGGDGTISEVVHGIVSSGDADVALGILPCGTGGDLARGLGVTPDPVRALSALASGPVQQVDVIRAEYAVPVAGASAPRFGINVAGVGMAGEVVASVDLRLKALGGTLAFGASTVATLMTWTAPDVRVSWVDDAGHAQAWSGALQNLFVANGRACGGGMWIAPHASLQDGLLDMIIIPAQPVPRLLANLPRLYRGAWEGIEEVVVARATQITLEPMSQRVRGDLDGELCGSAPVSFTCVPKALGLALPVDVG